MSKYTEQQLNGMNKTVLVALALELGVQLNSLQSGPLKGSDVEKTMLDLARQAANIKSNDQAREEQHKLALAKIEADKELALKKIELEFADTKGLDAAALEVAYKTIESKSKLAIEDLSFGLKKAEIATQGKIEELDEKLKAAKEEYQKAIDELQEKLSATRAKTNLDITTLDLNHKREMEQAAYDNAIALRDENLKAAEGIAAKHARVVVDKVEYTALTQAKVIEETEINARIDSAANAAKQSVYATEGTKFTQLKSSTDSIIALLENDKKYLSATIATLEARVDELSEQVKAFPSQLKDAVAAGKADISVNQDAGKK